VFIEKIDKKDIELRRCPVLIKRETIQKIQINIVPQMEFQTFSIAVNIPA
jgi:hypothetical protein